MPLIDERLPLDYLWMQRLGEELQRLAGTMAEPVSEEDIETSLAVYARSAWPLVEPSTRLIWNWHLDAICEHLQAVTDGEIRNLIITVPPRSGKSSVVSVMWPTWSWIKYPEMRWLFASYAQTLSTRDALRSRRVIQSQWYQLRWGTRFKLTGDQNQKTRYENDKTGYRLATSVGGSATGEGGSIIVCLPYDEHIDTEHGPMPIGHIVEQHLDIRVPSYDVMTGATALKPITGWFRNPGSRIIELGLSDGATLRCTPDHQIWTVTRGWVEAQYLQAWDMLPGAASADVVDSIPIDAELLGDGVQRTIGMDDIDDITVGQLCIRPILSSDPVTPRSNICGDISPHPSSPDTIHSPLLNAVLHGQDLSFFCTSSDLSGLTRGQFGSRSMAMDRESPVAFGIIDVHGTGTIFKISQPVMRGVPVEVSPLLPFGTWPDEGKQDELMDKPVFGRTVHTQTDPGIAFIRTCFQNLLSAMPSTVLVNSQPSKTLDPSSIGHSVQPFKSRYRFPVFIRHHSYAPITYCVEVEDYHTFYAGMNGKVNIICSNCDDPHNMLEIHSDTIREGVLLWWDEVMASRLNDPKTGGKVIVQQRGHERDLAGHVLEQGGYVHLNLPMEYESTTYVFHGKEVDPRTTPGELLCPERIGAAEVDDLKIRLGPTAFSGQYNQLPAPAGGNIFKRWWWRYWQPKGLNLPPVMVQVPDGDLLAIAPVELPETFDEMIQSWDLSFKDLKDSDYVAGHVWAKRGANKYLLDRDHRRMDFVSSQKAVKAMSEKWPQAHAKLIEDKANGPAIIASLKQDIAGLIAVEPDGSKEARAYAVTPTFEAGNVFVPHPQLYPWVSAFLHEHDVFPNGANDDDVDTTTQAIKRWIVLRRWLPVGS